MNGYNTRDDQEGLDRPESSRGMQHTPPRAISQSVLAALDTRQLEASFNLASYVVSMADQTGKFLTNVTRREERGKDGSRLLHDDV